MKKEIEYTDAPHDIEKSLNQSVEVKRPHYIFDVIEKAREAGIKGANSRWKDKDPTTKRDTTILLKLSKAEKNALDNKARDFGLSRADLVMAAVSEYTNVI